MSWLRTLLGRGRTDPAPPVSDSPSLANPVSISHDAVVADMREFASACGDDAAATLFSRAASDPAWFQGWCTNVCTAHGDHAEMDKLRRAVSASERADLRDVAELFAQLHWGQDFTDDEPFLLSYLRAALQVENYLVELDWKLGTADSLWNLDQLFGAHGLASITDDERSSVPIDPPNMVADLLRPMARLAASRGRTLLYLDIRSDSYPIALAESPAHNALIGTVMGSVAVVRAIEPFE